MCFLACFVVSLIGPVGRAVGEAVAVLAEFLVLKVLVETIQELSPNLVPWNSQPLLFVCPDRGEGNSFNQVIMTKKELLNVPV